MKLEASDLSKIGIGGIIISTKAKGAKEKIKTSVQLTNAAFKIDETFKTSTQINRYWSANIDAGQIRLYIWRTNRLNTHQVPQRWTKSIA